MEINSQKIKQAGISQRAIDYIYNVIDEEQKKAVLEDEAFQDTIASIGATDSVPQNAIEITTADQNAIAQLENGQGKTFVLRGNLNFGKTLNIPSNVTIYVDGTITKNGSHKPKFYDDENKGNSVDAVFRVDDKSNVKLIGVNNAKLVSNNRATGVYIEGSSNVEVRGFDIGNVWEGVVAHWGNSDVKIFNNYIHDTGKRAIWSLGSKRTQAAHNFIENAGGDGVDFDALTTENVAYENVVMGWRRWAGFVEEGAQDSYYAKNLGIMAEFEYKHPEPNVVPDRNLYPMGWADNGTTENIPRLTSNNYFIGNTLFKPSSYTRKNSGGGYFAKRNQKGKGPTYFWGNKGNVGFALDSNNNSPDSQENPQDPWYKANIESTVAPGQSTLDQFEASFPTKSSTPIDNPTPNSSIVVEAESMQLGGEYKVETIGAASGNKAISLRGGAVEGTGAAKFNFNGASGNYNVKIHYFDENDGVGKFNLKQGNQQIASVNLNKQLGSPLANEQTLTTTEVKNVSIQSGDSFTLESFEDGTTNTAEHVRIDKIEFIPTSQPIRINVGGDEFTDSQGQVWSADKYFNGGQTYTTTADISQTTDDPIFQSERFQKNLAYAIPVENGDYTVNLNFAENYFDAAGQRVFDVSAEGNLKLDNFDIYSATGGKNQQVKESFQVNVTDGVLNLDLNASVNYAKLSGIKILKDGSTQVPTNPDPLPKPIEGSGWYKAFEDNFDDNQFDTSTWYNRTDKAYKTSAIEESDGKLKLHNEYSKNGESTGAWIQSREQFKFGYYEAEVYIDKNTNGKIWPTWWVWGGKPNGTTTTEFDLFEYSGFAAKYDNNRPTTSHHYLGKKPVFPENKTKTTSDPKTNLREKTEPHKWGMLWTPWEVSFFYDREKYMTSKHPENAADPQEKLRLIFSTSPHLLVGPENEPANPMGNPTPGEALPSFIVDNVQVWQKDSYFDLIGNAIRINAGGDEFTDNSGKTWEQDKYFKNGQTYSTTAGISQTNDNNLFQSERYQNNLNYSIPLEKGNYTVNLTFAENYFDAAGERVFDVSAEGALKLDNLDIYNEAGGKNMILEKSFQVGVQDGFLNLDFSSSVDNAKISAIEILPN